MSATLYVTQFADAPVLTGLTVALCGALGLAGCFRAAAAFGCMFVVLVICVVTAKGVVAELPGLSEATGLRSPSGHVAGAVVLIGGPAMCAGRRHWILLAGMGAALIAITRVKLGVHTWPDVAAGGLIGFAILAGAVALGLTRALTEVPNEVGGPLVGVLVAAAIFLNGWHPGISRAASRVENDFPSWKDHPAAPDPPPHG